MKNTQLPTEIDELLWAAAESGDPALQADFEVRYPHLRGQLATRKAMVDVLRRSRPEAPVAPPLLSAPARPIRLWLAPAMAALLAALAFGAYFTTRALLPKENRGTEGQLKTGPIVGPNLAPEPNGRDYSISLDGRRPDADPGVAERPPGGNSPAVVKLPKATVSLLQALAALESQGKMKLQVMPGVQDETVKIPVANPDAPVTIAPDDLLRILEERAAIRVLDSGPEGLLILPLDKIETTEEGAARKSPVSINR